MPQDAFTLRYLCNELNARLAGGKVNRITEPTADEVILTLYTGKRTEKLLLNVNPASPRMGVISVERDSPLTAPNFCMLMRKHLLSSTLMGIELIGFDRIVKIDFMPSGEFFDPVKKTLYVELMGRYSNIILTENGKILGGNRGINMFDNGVRPLIVGQPYVFPPVGDKKLPNDQSLIAVFDSVEKANLASVICANVQGIAMSTANEIVLEYFNRNGLNKVEDSKDFFEFLNEFLLGSRIEPCVIFSGDEIKDVCVYPYKLISGEVKTFESLSDAENFYFEVKDRIKKFNNKRERLNSIVNTAIKKAKKRLVTIKSKENDAQSAEENRIKGELLLANIYRVKNGQTECTLENYYDGSQVTIALDERLSVSKNAESYYKKYNKQKRTLTALKPQREHMQTELDYLESLLDEIWVCEDIEELYLVQAEMEKASLIVERKTSNKKKEEQALFRNYIIKGYRVKVGRNNTENDKLTFTAKPDDVWVHAKDYHS